jgi:hypothetical protein
MDCPSTVGQFSSDFPCFLQYEGKAALGTPSRQAGRLSNLEIVNGCYSTHHRLHIGEYTSKWYKNLYMTSTESKLLHCTKCLNFRPLDLSFVQFNRLRSRTCFAATKRVRKLFQVCVFVYYCNIVLTSTFSVDADESVTCNSISRDCTGVADVINEQPHGMFLAPFPTRTNILPEEIALGYLVSVFHHYSEPPAPPTGRGRPPGPKKSHVVKSDRMRLDTMTRHEVATACLSVHNLEDEYRASKVSGFKFKMWWTGSR